MQTTHRLTILLAFTFSGCTGLIYESVWSHYLGLYLGHAAYAQTLTLGIFMGGMTLGAYLVSRHIGRIRNALLGYAVAELVLGFAGLIFHLAYTGLIGFSYEVVFPGLGQGNWIGVYKWTSAALIILPQSILLGCTFPLLCSALIRREGDGIGRHISILYFTNSIGAAAGAVIATFVLIPWIGMPGAMMVSGSANLLIGLAVFSVSRQPESPATTAPAPAAGHLNRLTLVVLAAALITGAVSFMYEIAWIRMLNLVLGTSLHAFEIMLSAFIAGLALGGLWIRSRIDRLPDLLRFTGLVQIVMGMAAISTLTLYHQSFAWVATLLSETLQRTDNGYLFYNLATSLISGLIMIPATFCAGMTLPLLTACLVRRGHGENAIGRVYASNTVGAIVGIVVAVHLGLTVLGLKWLIVAAGLIDVALGIFLIWHTGWQPRQISLRFRAAAAALAVPVAASLALELAPSRLAAGTYRYGLAESPHEIIYYRDGKTASVSVTRHGANGASIRTNGKPDAGLRLRPGDVAPEIMAEEVTMGMLGSMAALVDPDLERVANIGFGSGLTSHLVLSHPGVKTLDTIEIEPLMVDAARIFYARNRLVYDDRRSRIHFEDAKSFFASAQKKYDAIISEPSNPWVMGVGNLFSVEFYTQLGRYLEDDGILVQWLQLYELSLPTLLTVLNSLDRSFASYELYAANTADLIIVAAPDPATDIGIKLGWEQLPAGLRSELESMGLSNIESLRSRRLASKREIGALINATHRAANSDYYPLLALNAPRDRFKNGKITELLAMPALGVLDSPFRIPLLGAGDYRLDDAHPYSAQTSLARKYEDILLHGQPLAQVGFEHQGMLRALIQPEAYCHNALSRINWVVALYEVAAHANSFGSAELRAKLASVGRQFDCIGETEHATSALHRAILYSMAEFTPASAAAFRKIVADMLDSRMPAEYRAFIVSCYLSALIADPGAIGQQDIDLVTRLRPGFDLPQRWLEALLVQRITAPVARL